MSGKESLPTGPGSAPPPPRPNASSHSNRPLQQPSQALDPAAIKLTRGTSCVLCQQRKVRCDRNKPCANCVKAGAECRVIPPQPPRRRKKRLQEKDLLERLRKYEGLLAQHGVKFDAIDPDYRADDVDELENDFEGLQTSPEASTAPGSSRVLGPREQGTWFSLHKEFRASEQLLKDSFDEEDFNDRSLIHAAFDKMFANQEDGFPFIIGGTSAPVTHHHPSSIHILQLWQIYIDSINPLLKITHIPSIQSRIIEATSRLQDAPKNIEALMFAIYVVSIHSIDDAEAQRTFGGTKRELLARYFPALQQALVNASFMRMPDPLTLQAYLLYLMTARWYIDPRQVFCMMGIAVRLAQRMGLHRDPDGYGLSPFEVEQRRRLWWTLVSYDRRVGEMTGSTVTALTSGCDCKKPLNVNDSDLHMDGKEPPTPHTGPSEMLFALTRVELSMAVASNSNRDSFKMNPEKNAGSPKPGKPEVVTIRLAGQDTPPYTLEGFCAHIEGTYLVHCDPKIPLHFFTLTMTRAALCKMRIINFLVRSQSREAMPLKEVERDALTLGAIEMIEYDNVVFSSESLRPFRWYAMHYFPFPAYMFLVQELRKRISGPLVERAWDAMEANYELRGLLSNLHSPMHTAFGSLFVKAWTAHYESQRAAGKEVRTPHFMSVLQERVEKRRRARAENRPDPNDEQAPITFPRPRTRDMSSTSPDNAAMMTPPVDQSIGFGGTQPVMAPSSSASGDDTENMDWSFLIAGYQDADTFQGFTAPYHAGFGNGMEGLNNSSGGGPPMGGFGGSGGPPGPGGNMFGN
ncbi:fungal specific transcription factor domain-containing [Trichoderma arundinaceum]|uniref:Fungal specific transcription factor domain-containing n=1 Tax=Trichoderma arundinaceum TaxID=490622 RepID=A0A395NHZ9_TRIAR|nr:fungal specific transcription factor domain-containing [Trichoderma arundinaceum]